MNIKSGFILVDKPPKLTSNEVSVFIRRIVGSFKSGHIGTLDPKVTGVLPVAFGQATKFIRFLIKKPKVYVGIIKFKRSLSYEEVESLFNKFVGDIIQTPPKMSAVRKKPRKRHVFYLKILEKVGNRVLFETKVEAGTYIRTLCKDMGSLVGGAFMEELRRIAVGQFKTCFRLNEIYAAFDLCRKKNDCSYISKIVIPVDKMLDEYKRIIVKSSAAKNLKKGAFLMVPGILEYPHFSKNEIVRVYDEQEQFIGMMKMQINSDELSMLKRGVIGRMLRVYV